MLVQNVFVQLTRIGDGMGWHCSRIVLTMLGLNPIEGFFDKSKL